MSQSDSDFHGTTILCVRKNNEVAIGGDGQVTLGQTVFKHNAKKIRKMYNNNILAGFAGATADAFTLFEKFEEKIETLEKERDGLRLKLQLKHSEISDCLREKDQLREDLNRSVDGLEKYKEKYIDCKLVK